VAIPTEGVYEFGPFRLDAAERQLRRDTHVVSLTPKAFDVLMALVARAGHLVSKDALLHEVWPDTFVEEANLSYSVSLLRKALDDTAAPYRYIETVAKRGYRFTAAVSITESIPATINRRSLARRGVWLSIAAGAAVIIGALGTASFLYARRLHSHATPAASAPARPLTRLTYEATFQFYPTWSPNGDRIAYGAERGGNHDIFVQQVAGGPPVRLTDDPAPDWMPSWSPEGSRIVFRSERDGGGLFVVSALGGPAHRLTTFGYRPLWSPDGSRVLFYETPPRWLGYAPRIFTVADDGTPPKPVLETLPRPLDTCCLRGYGWHPDGRVSVFWGGRRLTPPDPLDGPGGWHFWTFSLDDGRVVRSEIAPDVLRGLDEQFTTHSGWLPVLSWSPRGDAIYLVSSNGNGYNIWRIGVDPISLRWVQGPERITSGPGSALALTLSPNGHRLAFVAAETTFRLHSFPFNPGAGRLTGVGVALANSAPLGFLPGVSPDGRTLVYVDRRSQLRIRSFAEGKESVLFEGDEFFRDGPRWSHDGSSLLYVRGYRGHGERRGFVRFSLADRREDLLTTPNLGWFVSGDWTSDARSVLASVFSESSHRWHLSLFPTQAAPHAEQQERVILDDPAIRVFPHRFSPDDRWIAVTGGPPKRPEGSKAFVLPIAGGAPVPIADGPSWEWQDMVQWSPDGRMIYFVSDRNGFFNVWGRRFDRRVGPVGPLLQVTTLDNPARTISPLGGGAQLAMAISRERLVVPLFETSGPTSIWMIDNIDR
jgi:Tol biopolymer transport system component/DNA-binding winged helix-turn-helix (wHTH) protein